MEQLLSTKLYIPLTRPEFVHRPRLVEQLIQGLQRKLTLVSAPAGFGKTMLVSEWVHKIQADTPEDNQILNKVAWLSLDEGDNDFTRFLAYFIAALQSVAENVGNGVLSMLKSPQLPPIESVLTALLNDLATIPDNFTLILDDYHVIDAKPVDHALTFLLEHLPPQMHLVISTREDPLLPLARLRARDQLTELRAADLRFTPSEAAEFLNQVMGLGLPAEDIAILETRTEGWIAGLQMAAISMQGHKNTTDFIQSFSGSHRFVMDYLVEEVLQQQPKNVQTFLLSTSILDRLCGPLCDAVVLEPSASGQETLEYLERTNLFVVPMDNERRWYRYHHLFADLLRQRLRQSAALFARGDVEYVNELHIRASQWYEDSGLDIEAFRHAAAANDIERAERLIEGKGMPLQFRGALTMMLNWLGSLPTSVLDARPSLWSTYAQVLLATGQTTPIEEKLQAAEKALEGAEMNEKNRDIVGRIAATRAMLALSQYQIEAIVEHSLRALEYLSPDNLPFRTSTVWKMGVAYQFQGNRAEARKAYIEAISISQKSGNAITEIMALTGLGSIQEADNQLTLANQTYQHVLELTTHILFPYVCEAYLGLVRIFYQWNNLDTSEQYRQKAVPFAQQLENTDRPAACEVLLARLKLAQGDVDAAAAILAKVDQVVRQHNFVYQLPELIAAQVIVLLRQGNQTAAAQLAFAQDLPISQARVYLAQADPSAALATLEPYRRKMEARGWEDERLKVMVLQAVAIQAQGEKNRAVQLLGEALTMAEPGGFVRIFIDEGAPIAQLLNEAAAQGMKPDYISKLLAAFEAEPRTNEILPLTAPTQPLSDLLSQRELEVLHLIAQGLSNREISEKLFLALDTVKGHTRRIYGKLQVQRRTEAVSKARALQILPQENKKQHF